MTTENQQNYLEILTLPQRQFLFGFINLNQKDLVIDWDLDQTLEITEDPVKAAVDAKYAKYGTKYSERRIDGWDTITKWLVEDKLMDETSAREYERSLWVNNEILKQGLPNKHFRWLSYEADKLGIRQKITTIRSPGLRMTTYKWIDKYFWWIKPGDVNFRIGMDNGFEFKVGSILNEYKKHPGLIHIDDDLTIIKPLASAAPDLGLIGIKYPSDDVTEYNHTANRVFLERDVLNNLIPYKSSEEKTLVHP